MDYGQSSRPAWWWSDLRSSRDDATDSWNGFKGKAVVTASSSLACRSVEELVGGPTVQFSIDGLPLTGAFELYPDEHERRQTAGVGAITCRALLHGLWLLPPGGSTPHAMLPDVKVQRLRAAPQVAIENNGGFVRTYEPPGVLRSVAFYGRNVKRSVDRAARFTPIVQRFVFVEEHQVVHPSVEWVAREWGVGIIGLRQGSSPRVLVPASLAEIGVPSVYRWWVAELAYERYLQECPSG